MIEKSLSYTSRAARDRPWWSIATKRTFDVALSTVVLVILAPFFGLIALALRRDSPGPVIYRGERLGRDGRSFKIFKFRTMYETPESYLGPRVTAQDDPRVTRLGHWLRATKLNELPQFWNVLKGEMSLVGPRPEDPSIAARWPKAVLEEILSVRPGITSPASVVYHDEEALLHGKEAFRKYIQELGPDKARLDQLYVQHRSFWLDLDTLLWTLLILMPRLSAYGPPEGLLFVGPITRLIRRYVDWLIIDGLVALAAVGTTGLLWRAHGPLHVGWPKAAAAALGFAVLFSATGAVLGVNRIAWSKAAPEESYSLFAAWSIAAISALAASGYADLLPSGLVITASVLALAGFIAVRYRSRLVTGTLRYLMRHRAKSPAGRERVLIVGSGQGAHHAAWILGRPENAERFQVLGYVDDDLAVQGMRMNGVEVVGTRMDITRLMEKHNIDLVVVADDGATQDGCQSIVEACRRTNARWVFMPNLVDPLSDLCGGSPPASKAGAETGSNGNPECFECLARRSGSQQQGGTEGV